MEILQNLIHDKQLSWEKSLDSNTNSFLKEISEKAISELYNK